MRFGVLRLRAVLRHDLRPHLRANEHAPVGAPPRFPSALAWRAARGAGPGRGGRCAAVAAAGGEADVCAGGAQSARREGLMIIMRCFFKERRWEAVLEADLQSF